MVNIPILETDKPPTVLQQATLIKLSEIQAYFWILHLTYVLQAVTIVWELQNAEYWLVS